MIQKIPTNQTMRIEYVYYKLLWQRSRDYISKIGFGGNNGGNNGGFVRIQQVQRIKGEYGYQL